MADLNWSPVSPGFGAQIHDLDLEAAIAPDTASALRALWEDRGLLLFRGQPISDAAQVRLTEVFGIPQIHKASDSHVAHQRELMTIASNPTDNDAAIYRVNGVDLANWQPWHIDTIYTKNIEYAGILRGVEIPDEPADTGFIDRAQVYDRLPDDLRKAAEDVRVLYHLTLDFTSCPFNYYAEARVVNMPERLKEMQRRSDAQFPIVSHPAVLDHPATGRRMINIGTLHALGIEGRENAEGDALLRRLVAASVELGDRYYHRWQPHDIVVWDNWRFLHSAEGTPSHARRTLQRSGVDGHYAFGREVRKMAERSPAL